MSQILTEAEIINIAAQVASNSLKITRFHELGGPTRTTMEEAGVVELGRAIESAVLAKIATTPAASPIPIDAELERAAFEAKLPTMRLDIFDREGLALDRREDGLYKKVWTELLWRGWLEARTASTTPEPSPLVAPKPLPGELVIKAIRATDAEASRRGEMFPQTSDEQDDDRKAVCRVIGMMEFYTSERQSRDGWPSVKDWPALPAAPVRATEGEA